MCPACGCLVNYGGKLYCGKLILRQAFFTLLILTPLSDQGIGIKEINQTIVR